MTRAKLQIPWADIDTVLADMDGTLLDLSFDNFFWLELVPAQYARLRGLDDATARTIVEGKYASVAGTLPWYCVDHWSGELGVDIRALKKEHGHLIRYLPMVPEFLASVRGRAKPLIVVTNAHRAALEVKLARTGLDQRVDRIISSHEFDAPKESPTFWLELERRQRLDPRRTLLLEDSIAVLQAARAFGIRHAVAIRRPDSRLPPRAIEGFDSVDGVAELL
jgi:putative hydrolase of the HAD superfamily